jgi:hypothetical protein
MGNFMFWKDVFVSFEKLYKQVELSEGKELAMEPIFYNEKFLIGHRVVHFKKWMQNHINTVRDIIDNNGHFLTHRSFVKKNGIQVNFLDYMGCLQSIKEYKKKRNIIFQDNKSEDCTKAIMLIVKVQKGSKAYYDILLGKLDIRNIKSFNKWDAKLNIHTDWVAALKHIKKIKEIQFKWFQTKICHTILVTNSILREMGVVDGNTCIFCHREKDTIEHYIFTCRFSQSFWLELEHILKERCGHLRD